MCSSGPESLDSEKLPHLNSIRYQNFSRIYTSLEPRSPRSNFTKAVLLRFQPSFLIINLYYYFCFRRVSNVTASQQTKAVTFSSPFCCLAVVSLFCAAVQRRFFFFNFRAFVVASLPSLCLSYLPKRARRRKQRLSFFFFLSWPLFGAFSSLCFLVSVSFLTRFLLRFERCQTMTDPGCRSLFASGR